MGDIVEIDTWLLCVYALATLSVDDPPAPTADCSEEPPLEGTGLRVPRRRVRTHAIFVARMTMVLRARLGRLTPEPANQLLVHKEYSRILRKPEYNMRAVDVEMHRRDVVNTYFSDLEYERVPLARSRMPRWFKELMGVPEISAAPLVC